MLPSAGPGWSAAPRVLRGGSWNNNPRNLRSAARNMNNPDNRNNNVGFRLASTPSAGVPGFTDPGSEHGASRTVHDELAGACRPDAARVRNPGAPPCCRRRGPARRRRCGGVNAAPTRATPARSMGPALEAMHVFLRWAIPTLEKFPRSQKFLLADRMQAIALDALERLIQATFTRERRALLEAANLDIEKLRHLFRLAVDLRLIDERRHEHAQRELDTIGRMIGGWRKEAARHAGRSGDAAPA
jgi:hypothetical protein